MSDEKKRLRVLHPSMSNASLLLQCQWWVGKAVSTQPLDVVEMHEDGVLPKAKTYAPAPSIDITALAVWKPPATLSADGNALSETEGANYGSAIHEYLAAKIVSPPKKIHLAKVAMKWGINEVEEIRAFTAHAEEAVDTFIRWMTKKNPWGVDLTRHAKIRTEMAVAYNVEKNTTRLIPTPTADTHEYRGLEIGELPGTADVVIDEIDRRKHPAYENVPDLILIDHKSGDGWSMPAENAQLNGLTIANAVRIGAKSAAMGIYHTPIENVSTMYIDEIDREQMKEFRVKLKAAWRRIGDGSLRPGPHCSFCPAATICPTQMSAIVQVETSLAMTPERVGEIAQKLAVFRKSADKIDDEVKAWIKNYGLPGSDKSRAVPMPSGKWYRTKPTKQGAWQITTKQLREVLGVEAAEKIFEALRAAGYLKDREYDDWKTVNDV